MKTNKQVNKTEFKTVVRKAGNSGHIILPSSMIDKEVLVTVVVLN